MRVLAHGPSLGRPGSRLATALGGLALRGHEVHWLGPGVPAGVREALTPVAHVRALPGAEVDIVVAGGQSPSAAALCGWLAGARVLVLDLTCEILGRWGPLERWAWHSIACLGLVEESEAERLAADPRGLERERLGIWPAGPRAPAPDAAHRDTEVLERAGERALARHRGRAARPGVFLDRDGTLIREVPYLADPEGVELLPGVGRALRNLVEAGYPLIVVSNQSAIARGLLTAARAHAVMARLRERLRRHGVELTAIYLCPHHPDEGCSCRKPRAGLLRRAAEDLQIALEDSVMIGDRWIDAATGRHAGGLGVLVRTGEGREEEARDDDRLPAPDGVCDDLPAAVDWFLSRAAGT